MEKFDNISFLLSQIEKESNSKDVPKDIYRLVSFVAENSFFKKVDRPFGIKKKDNGYLLYCGTESYFFEILSEKKILNTDKKNLQNSKKRLKKSFLRSLRIATTNDLLAQKLLFIFNILGFNVVVEYEKDGEKRIIDYSMNIIMKKEDYFKLFKAKLINSLDKETLYRFYENFNEEGYIDLVYILLAGREIIEEVSKIKPLNDTNSFAPNSLNDKIIGADCDGIFLGEEDADNNLMDEEIDKFTLNPSNLGRHIKNNGEHFYYQKNIFSKKVFFDRLDSCIDNEKIREILQSEDRYGHCHVNSPLCLKFLAKDSYDEAYVVSGKIAVNKYQYFYHSWVEFTKDNKTMVIDFNRNLVMRKEDYYNMKKAVVINKSDLETIDKLFSYEELFKLYLPSQLEVYFAQEFIKDFEKNISLVKK